MLGIENLRCYWELHFVLCILTVCMFSPSCISQRAISCCTNLFMTIWRHWKCLWHEQLPINCTLTDNKMQKKQEICLQVAKFCRKHRGKCHSNLCILSTGHFVDLVFLKTYMVKYTCMAKMWCYWCKAIHIGYSPWIFAAYQSIHFIRFFFFQFLSGIFASNIYYEFH